MMRNRDSDMGKCDPLLREIFNIENSSHSVSLYHHQISWCPIRPGGEDLSDLMTVKTAYIFSAEVGPALKFLEPCCNPLLKSHSEKAGGSGNASEGLLVHFAKRKDSNSVEWSSGLLYFVHNDPVTLRVWLEKLEEILDDLRDRPRNILFFVNPYGGKRKAPNIFSNKVKPILDRSNVKWTVINTQRRNHASEFLTAMSDEDINSYDVAVAVGGDGTACEVVTGLLSRGLQTFTPSLASASSPLKPSPILIGVIPAGSSNALAYSVHGTDDVTTAAIHIILGNSVPLDVGLVQNSTGIVRFIVTQMSYGHLADTLQESEKLRWMGPHRYDFAGLKKYLGHATYNGSLDIRIPIEETESICCDGGLGCRECQARAKLDIDETETKWKRVEGCFLGISGANVSCRCRMSRTGLAPYAHLSDGFLDLILIRKASRLDHLKYLLRTANDSREAFDLPFVERYRVKELIFAPTKSCVQQMEGRNGIELDIPGENSSTSISDCGCDFAKKNHSGWNCDGEFLSFPSVRVSVHSNLIKIMAPPS